MDKRAMRREMLTREELIQVIHRQNITGLGDVKLCVLEPNGTFYVESTADSVPRQRHDEVQREIATLRPRDEAERTASGG